MTRGSRVSRLYVFIGDDPSEVQLKDHGVSAVEDRLSLTLELGGAVTLDLTTADTATLLALAHELTEAAHRQETYRNGLRALNAPVVAVMPLHERGPLDG